MSIIPYAVVFAIFTGAGWAGIASLSAYAKSIGDNDYGALIAACIFIPVVAFLLLGVLNSDGFENWARSFQTEAERQENPYPRKLNPHVFLALIFIMAGVPAVQYAQYPQGNPTYKVLAVIFAYFVVPVLLLLSLRSEGFKKMKAAYEQAKKARLQHEANLKAQREQQLAMQAKLDSIQPVAPKSASYTKAAEELRGRLDELLKK